MGHSLQTQHASKPSPETNDIVLFTLLKTFLPTAGLLIRNGHTKNPFAVRLRGLQWI